MSQRPACDHSHDLPTVPRTVFVRCCWCQRRRRGDHLAGVLRTVWHLSCPMCLRHTVGYPLAHTLRLFWRTARQERLGV